MSRCNSNPSTNGSQSPSYETTSSNTSPDLLSAPLASRTSDDTHSHNTLPRATPNKMPVDLPRPTSAGRGGCWTCRLRRKKCDELRDGNSCHTCKRLKIECLGWGPRRPDWMRDKRAVDAYKAEIKAKLTRAGLIRGQPRSTVVQATSSSSSSSTVFATEQYQSSAGAPTITSFNNSPGTPSLAMVDTTQPQGQGESPRMMSMFGFAVSSPFNVSLPLSDAPFPHLISQSPYTPSTSLSSSHPSPQDLGFFDSTFDSVTAQALGFGRDATTVAANTLPSDHVLYYFEHVRKSLFAFASNSAANIIYSLVSQDPQGPLTNAICALSCLHNMRIRAASGLEPENNTLENSQAILFYDAAHAQLYKARHGALTEGDAIAALHLLSFALFSGGVTDWRAMLDIANDWMAQTGIATNENPELAMMSMSPAARLALKATMWLDVMSTITLRTIPKHLPFYRRLYRGGAGFWATSGISATEDTDLRVDTLIGCPDEILLGIAEISTLSCWKAQETRKGCLSMKELIRRGNIVESHLRSQCEEIYAREPEPTQLHPDLPVGADLNTNNGIAGIQSVGDTRQLVGKIYREAAILYLHTVLSDPNPGVPEIVQSIEIITHLVHQLPMSTLDRTMVFPIYLAGCLSDDPMKREMFKTRFVGQQSHFGNIHQALMVMETAWDRRDARRGVVEWRDLLHVQGRSLLLLV